MVKRSVRPRPFRALAGPILFALLITLLCSGPALAVAPPATSAGTAISWGNDADGELGIPSDNTGLAYASPAVVGTNAVQVATADGHALVLSSNGAVYAWGDGNNGDLGQGAGAAEQDTPVQVQMPAGADIVSVAAGQYSSYAITASGQVYAWGDDESGQLGNGSKESSSTVNGTPEPIAGLSGVTQIVTGGQSFDAYVAALTSSGEVYTWGTESAGVLGNGVSGDGAQFDVTPTAVSGVAGATQIAGGAYDVFALTPGAVYGWGYDSCDELGNNVGENCHNGTVEASPVEVDFPAGVDVDSIGFGGAGPGHGIASSSTGALYIWGQGSAYSNGDYYTPTAFAVPGGAPILEVDASGNCNYALTTGGVLYANGAYDDSCGFGTSGSSLLSPLQQVPVPSGLHVLQFAGGDAYGAAVAGASLPGTPTVTAVSPASGPAAGGNAVTITGTGFAAGAAVYFGTAAATNVMVKSSKLIVATAPAGSDTVDIFVALNGTSSPLTNADRYTYTSSSNGTPNPNNGQSGSNSGTTGVGKTTSSGGTASVSLSCVGPTGSSCHMAASLSVVETVSGGRVLGVAARSGETTTRKTKTKHRTVVLATISLTLQAGASRTVKLTLNRAGRSLLSSRHALHVRLAVTQGGHVVGTRTLSFTTRKKKR
jgi:hypothetical protein